MNPLDIEVIRSLVFQCLAPEPRYLLPCLLVNHAWHEDATRLLTDAGWAVHLKGTNINEYLKLIKSVSRSNFEGSKMTLDLGQMNISVCASTKEQIKSAIEIVRHIREDHHHPEFGLISLECILAPPLLFSCSGIPALTYNQELLNLIELSAPTLRHLSFKMSYDGDNRRYSQFLTSNVEKPFYHDGLRLNKLESLSVEYCKTSNHATTKVGILNLISIAPNLKCIRGLRSGRAPSANGMTFMEDVLDFAYHRKSVKDLFELELYVAAGISLWTMVPAQTDRFGRLRTLSISTDSCIFLSSVEAGANENQNLLSFIRRKCPRLQSLEIKVVDCSVDALHFPIDVNIQRLGAQIPRITHFAFYILTQEKETALAYQPPLDRNMQQAETSLKMMTRFPNLTSVALNFAACLNLATLYLRRLGDLQILRLLGQRADLTRLTLSLDHGSFPDFKQYRLRNLSEMAYVLATMCPDVKHISFNLGADRVIWKVSTDLRYVMKLCSRFEKLKKVEINNYYNAWTIAPLRDADAPSQPQPSTSKNHNNQKLTVERITIRGATRSFAAHHVDTAAYQAPSLSLAQVLALVPENALPFLEIQIDADLLLNGERRLGIRDSLTYAQLLEEVGSMHYPRLKLI